MNIRGLMVGFAAAALCVTVSGMPRSNRLSRARVARTSTSTSHVPERPRRSVDVTAVTPTGRTIYVKAGGDLQAAIDDARPGDAIELEPGGTYHGPFKLRRKDGNG